MRSASPRRSLTSRTQSSEVPAGAGDMQTAGKPRRSSLMGWLVAGALLVVVVAQCSMLVGRPSVPLARPILASLYVQPKNLNCRAEPLRGSPVLEKLTRGEKVDIIDQRSSWRRLDRPADCWVAASLLTETEPAPAASAPVGFVDSPQAEAYRPASRRGASGAFADCSAARAAGAAPVRRGDPGYSRRLDRDGDGVGCE